MIRLVSRLVDVLGDHLLRATQQEMDAYEKRVGELRRTIMEIEDMGVNTAGVSFYGDAKSDLNSLKDELKSHQLDYRVDRTTGKVTVYPIEATPGGSPTSPQISGDAPRGPARTATT